MCRLPAFCTSRIWLRAPNHWSTSRGRRSRGSPSPFVLCSSTIRNTSQLRRNCLPLPCPRAPSVRRRLEAITIPRTISLGWAGMCLRVLTLKEKPSFQLEHWRRTCRPSPVRLSAELLSLPDGDAQKVHAGKEAEDSFGGVGLCF